MENAKEVIAESPYHPGIARVQFPVGMTLEEMRAAIHGRPEFVEKKYSDYVIFNYKVRITIVSLIYIQYSNSKTFPNPNLASDEKKSHLYRVLRYTFYIEFSLDILMIQRMSRNRLFSEDKESFMPKIS
jgi:hypothetical protein